MVFWQSVWRRQRLASLRGGGGAGDDRGDYSDQNIVSDDGDIWGEENALEILQGCEQGGSQEHPGCQECPITCRTRNKDV